MQITEFDKARLWSKVRVPRKMAQFVENSQCWIWSGANVRGRGQIKIDGSYRYVPRVVWEIFFGDPFDLYVCHTCDNPACVNPKHLFLGTSSDNQTDCAQKGRKRSKVTPEIVRSVRQECIPNDKSFGYSALSRKYNVNPGVIWNVYNRKRWVWVMDNSDDRP